MTKHKYTFIYMLVCPVTKKVHYIGQSVNPKIRLIHHSNWSVTSNDALTTWLKILKHRKDKPEIILVDYVPIENANEIERDWIKFGEEMGWPLLNKTYTKGKFSRNNNSEILQQIRKDLKR